MAWNMSGCDGVTGGAGCGDGRRARCIASGSMGCKCSGARLAQLDLSARPGAARFNGSADSMVLRAFILEVFEDACGTVGSPER
jgi:hypothetical protein